MAVALYVANHEDRAIVVDALEDKRSGLAGHAAFETFSDPQAQRRGIAVVDT